jgi:hypothetical protein
LQACRQWWVGILIAHEPTRWVLANDGHWLAGWLAGGLWSLRGVSVGKTDVALLILQQRQGRGP